MFSRAVSGRGPALPSVRLPEQRQPAQKVTRTPGGKSADSRKNHGMGPFGRFAPDYYSNREQSMPHNGVASHAGPRALCATPRCACRSRCAATRSGAIRARRTTAGVYSPADTGFELGLRSTTRASPPCRQRGKAAPTPAATRSPFMERVLVFAEHRHGRIPYQLIGNNASAIQAMRRLVSHARSVVRRRREPSARHRDQAPYSSRACPRRAAAPAGGWQGARLACGGAQVPAPLRVQTDTGARIAGCGS